MTQPFFSYSVNDITIREAFEQDMPELFCISEIACQQKRDNLQPSSMSALYNDYKTRGDEVILDSWEAKGSRFFVANVPAEHVSLNIADAQGQAIAGFCAGRYDPEDNPDIFYLDRLYSIRSAQPVGSVLMSHCIRMAQETDAEQIMLQAPYAQSQKWYEERALFKTMDGQGSIIARHYNMMSLYRENFDDALESLNQPLIKPVTNKIIYSLSQ